MTEQEKREHAVRLAQEWLKDFEFSNVYEDEQLEDAEESDQREIHDLVVKHVRATLS